MDYDALAKKYGGVSQPATQNPNWMGGLSPKDQAEMTMKMHQEARKRIAELDEDISKGSAVLNDLQRFGELNRNSRTGGIWENILPGTPFLHGSDENEMYSIQARLGPSQRTVGSGASSDRDVALFLSGLPRIENTGDVNKNIRTEFEKRYNKAVAKKSAMEKYLNANGNLMGFDEAWNKQNQTKPKSIMAPRDELFSRADAILRGK